MARTDAWAGLASGDELHAFAASLYPICRSLTGNGVRQTLRLISEQVPALTTHEVPTGTQAFDWTVPNEWNVRSAYIEDSSGKRVIDFANHNLHVVGYSTAIDTLMSLEDLQNHLHSLPEQPDVIPYVTSYYAQNWGFCLSHDLRQSLQPGQYRVVIDADLKPGYLTYGEIFLPGSSSDEILLSTYICHPSMANNELSGPVIATYMAKWLLQEDRKYSYRILFVPETIGTLVYLSRHLGALKEHVRAGFVLTCCGDDGSFSYMPSRTGLTYADKVAVRVLSEFAPSFVRYSFAQRGSDERQYCSPLVDLPVCSIMRSKYHEYPQYHTSADDLTFVTSSGLRTTLEMYATLISEIEANDLPRAVFHGEPQLGKRGLYPTMGGQVDQASIAAIIDLLALADGTNDLKEIVSLTGHAQRDLDSALSTLVGHGLLMLHPLRQ